MEIMENDNNNLKPRATLIKQPRKTDEQPINEHKKRVVRKRVVVKTAAKETPLTDSDIDKAEPEHKAPAQEKPVSARKNDSSESDKSLTRKDKPNGSAKNASLTTPRKGVQVYELKRVGGKAGVVAGRHVENGKFQNSFGWRKKPFGGNRDKPGSSHHGENRPGGQQRPGGTGQTRPSKQFGDKPPNRPASHRGSGKTAPPSAGFGGQAPKPAPSAHNKKFYKAKKVYEKNKEKQEKLYQFAKKKQVIQTNPVPKEIDIMEVVTVSALARKMNLRASELISKLMGMGMMVNINQQIDAETASILAHDYDCKVNIVNLYDETIIESDKADDKSHIPRSPIVTVMGHVDHGKTKLLDAIRDADVMTGEHGGITQHIGAYMVHTEKGNITFLDTPGHSAFTKMRARGAQVTDIVVLVVAANEGAMPRTIEAIEHAIAAGSPIIVAVNKMDLPDANPERVKQQLSEYNLLPTDWGGKTEYVEISALNGSGIDHLLEVILLEAALLELKADWECRAEGKVIESKVDPGRGVVSTVLVQNGRLRVGDAFVAGIYYGKVRALFNDMGEPVDEATPSMPVEIIGFSGIPNAGDPFQVTENEREARQYGTKRMELKKMESTRNLKKITLENLYDTMQDGAIRELKVIIKGDVHGSVEALQSTLEGLSTNEVKLICIRAAAGAIIEDDVNLAAASNAIIIGFHVRPTPRAMKIAELESVEIKRYNVIFEAVEDIKAAMEGMLAPEFVETAVGQVEVRETFKVPKIGIIAGCMVTSGYITRKTKVHLYRDNVVVHTGNLASLKRFKDDVKEVREGYECGIGLEKFTDIQVGDIIEVFEVKEVTKKLGTAKNNE